RARISWSWKAPDAAASGPSHPAGRDGKGQHQAVESTGDRAHDGDGQGRRRYSVNDPEQIAGREHKVAGDRLGRRDMVMADDVPDPRKRGEGYDGARAEAEQLY